MDISGLYLDDEGRIEAPAALSVATYSDALKQFLARSGVAFIEDSNACRTAAQADEELKSEVDNLRAELEARDELRAAEMANDDARHRAQIREFSLILYVGGAILVLALVGLIVFAINQSNRRAFDFNGYEAPLPSGNARSQHNTLVTAIIALVIVGGAVIVWFMVSDRSGQSIDVPPAQGALVASTGVATLQCRVDPEWSYGDGEVESSTAFTFDRAATCVNGRTRYTTIPGGYERLIVAPNTRHIIINRFNEDLGAFSQDSFVVSAAEWTAADNLAKATIKGCPTPQEDEQLAQLKNIKERVGGQLSSTPARRVVWRCTQ